MAKSQENSDFSNSEPININEIKQKTIKMIEIPKILEIPHFRY